MLRVGRSASASSCSADFGSRWFSQAPFGQFEMILRRGPASMPAPAVDIAVLRSTADDRDVGTGDVDFAVFELTS